MTIDRKKWFKVVSFVFLATAVTSNPFFLQQAMGEDEERLNLQELVQEALSGNPEIQAAKEAWEQAQSRPSQARSLPDPQIRFGLRNVGSEVTVGREQMSVAGGSIVQRLPFPGKLRLRGEVAQREADRQEALYQATRLRVVSGLKVAYYDLYVAYKSLETIERSKALLEDLEMAAEARYATGRGIQQDVLRAQVEISRLIDRDTIEGARKEALEGTINALLNRPPLAPLGRPEEIKAPSPGGRPEARNAEEAGTEVLKAAVFSSPSERSRIPWSLEEVSGLVERSPQLEASESTIAQREASLTLARKEYLPDFSLNGGFFSRGDFRDMWEVMFTVSIPIYYKTKQDYGVREAVSALQSSRRSYRATSQVLLARLKKFYVEARAAERLANLFRRGIIPQANLSLESAMAGYQVGKVDLLTVLDNLLRLLDDELRYYDELAKLEKALAQIEEIVGVEAEG